MWKRLPEEPSSVATGQKTFPLKKKNYNVRAQTKCSGGIYCHVKKNNPESLFLETKNTAPESTGTCCCMDELQKDMLHERTHIQESQYV